MPSKGKQPAGRLRTVRCPLRIDFGGATTDLEPYAKRQQGVVLSAAITRYASGTAHYSPSGVSLSYHCEVPPASGLGASGAMNLCWLALVSSEEDKIALAELAYHVEQTRGERGGRQDQYASALGGINLFRFHATVEVEPLIPKLPDELTQRLSDRLLLVYAMDKPASFSKLDQDREFLTRFSKGDDRLFSLLDAIKATTLAMHAALIAGRLTDFGYLLNEEWALRKQLHPRKTNPTLDRFIASGLKHAIGAKPCGSAGGGFVLLYTEDKEKLKSCLDGRILWDVSFDSSGLQIETRSAQ